MGTSRFFLDRFQIEAVWEIQYFLEPPKGIESQRLRKHHQVRSITKTLGKRVKKNYLSGYLVTFL